MNDQTIKAIVEEIAPVLEGSVPGKVFQLSRFSLALDIRPGDGRYLFISVEPGQPRIYLIRRRLRDLEKQSVAPGGFALVIRKQLFGAEVVSARKDQDDRIVRFSFSGTDEIGESFERTLVAQLTGKAANLFLLDGRGHNISMLRSPRGEGQEIGSLYQPPPPHLLDRPALPAFEMGSFQTLSEAADNYYLGLEAERRFDSRCATARANLQKAIAQREKLRSHLTRDLEAHGDAEEHKRIGDLMLANIGTEKREGSRVFLTDYFAENMPSVEIELDENLTLQQEAARRFSRYGKARRASHEIALRRAAVETELQSLHARRKELENVIESRDETTLETFTGEAKDKKRNQGKSGKSPASVPGARRYRSSEGYEILVGRAARDNDHLTFRVARPNDLWLHAADYPGSHVIVRNPNRTDIPHRTVIEAAQLAAAFSQARRDAKVDVHYTQRKFLAKPKGAAPGLVRMASFRSITVEPREAIERI